MTGSLQKKKGYYYAVLNFYNEDNKRTPKWFPTGLVLKNNKKKAEAILNNLITEHSGFEKIPKYAYMSVYSFVAHYLENKKLYIDMITYEGHITDLKHIDQYFTNTKLLIKDIEPQHIKNFYDFLLCHGKLVKRKGESEGLCRKSVKHVSDLLKCALDDAVIYKALKTNPARGVIIPTKTSDKKRREEEFLDSDDVKYFLTIIKGHRLESLFVFALFYGMRRSEVLGLKWTAIDFNKKELVVRHTVSYSRSIVAKDATKTDSSYRKYPIPDFISDILVCIRKEQCSNKKLFGEAYLDSGYVFTWEDGRLYSPDYYSKNFKKIVRRDERLSS